MNLKGTFVLFFLLALALPGTSQFKSILLDELAGAQGLGCQPTIAVNPRYPTNIVAGSLPDNVYYTKDAGKSWHKGKISSPLGVEGSPTVISDEKGNFFYFHLSNPTGGSGGGYETEKLDRIVVQTSDNGGETWSAGESIGMNHPKDQAKQWATADTRGNLYVTWTQFDRYSDAARDCQSNILYSMSKNGKKWSDPVVISQFPGNCVNDDSTAIGAVPAVTFDGKVMIAWSNRNKIFLDRSFNGGDWWLSNDIVVADLKGGSKLDIPGHDRSNGMPVLITDNSKSSFRGSLYIVWSDQRNGTGDTDIWFTRSHNFGDNWSLPMRVNNDGKGKHQYLPWLAVDQSTGYLYIVYYDRRNYEDNRTDVYLAYSTDGGASFKNVLISEKAFTPQDNVTLGDYNNISAHKGVIAAIWTRVEDDKTSVWTSIIRHEDLEKTGAASE